MKGSMNKNFIERFYKLKKKHKLTFSNKYNVESCIMYIHHYTHYTCHSMLGYSSMCMHMYTKHSLD